MDDLYLENIDEFIHDHNKIVTYKWLSLTLGVHVNQAKQMLYHYLDQKRKESSGSQLHATYLVSGKFIENGNRTHKVAVVREDQLEDVKSKMELTVSVHVYSIQKAALKDSGPLYSTDYDAVRENLKNCCKYSAIQCTDAAPTSSAGQRQGQEMAVAPSSEPEARKPVLNGSSPPTSSKQTVKQPKGIMEMFNNKNATKTQDSSKEVKTEVKENTSQQEASKTKPTAKANAMNNFFGKSAANKAATSREKSDKAIKEEVVAQTSNASEEKSLGSPKTEAEVKEEGHKSSTTVGKKSKDGRSKTKRIEESDSEVEKFESQKKKRRRIKKPQPDSSDDEVIPDSPSPQDVDMPTPSPENKVKKEPASHAEENTEGKRRKRRRVLKARTFLDEEGCMVTEKVYESESFSESEDDFKSNQRSTEQSSAKAAGKKEEENKGQKKTSANSGKATKQSSIVGFFQKK